MPSLILDLIAIVCIAMVVGGFIAIQLMNDRRQDEVDRERDAELAAMSERLGMSFDAKNSLTKRLGLDIPPEARARYDLLLVPVLNAIVDRIEQLERKSTSGT